ncbi:MAG: copper-binding protein [Burkholderiaceae bacterium]
MTNRTLLLAALLMAHAATPALAQQKSDDHAKHHASAPSAADMTAGEVRKVDKEARKITIKHGEIKNLDMPPMTMVFQVKDAAMLDKVKPGDNVRFVVEKNAAGAFVVTEMQSAK